MNNIIKVDSTSPPIQEYIPTIKELYDMFMQLPKDWLYTWIDIKVIDKLDVNIPSTASINLHFNKTVDTRKTIRFNKDNTGAWYYHGSVKQ